MHSESTSSTATSIQARDIADIVLDGKAYDELMEASRSQSGTADNVQPLVASPQSDDIDSAPSTTQPMTSMAELVLSNVTYDKILSSSAKALSLDSRELPTPLTSPVDDARTPPNSPTNTPSHHSLLGASSTIMESVQSDVEQRPV